MLILIYVDNMRPRIKKESLTPSSVKVFSTVVTPEEKKKIDHTVSVLKELDTIRASKQIPEFAYVKIFGIEKRLPMSEIQKCNLKWYTK